MPPMDDRLAAKSLLLIKQITDHLEEGGFELWGVGPLSVQHITGLPHYCHRLTLDFNAGRREKPHD